MKTHRFLTLYLELENSLRQVCWSNSAKIGEDRQRFSQPGALQALAGTAPVTKQSGGRYSVHFRRACDKDFRYFMQQFARCSLPNSPWAAAYFHNATQRGLAPSHAYRCLANRWIVIIWRLWQDRTTYDEAYHIQRRSERRAPKS